jgi:hypothetical protein
MEINVKHGGRIFFLRHNVRVPNFLEEGEG